MSPVILLTGLGDRSLDESAMRQGAADYLIKGQLTPERLERSIRHTLGRTRKLQGLLESRNELRLLLDGVGDHAIFLLTPDGHVATWNAGAERMSGYSEAEIVGEPMSRFYTEAEGECEWPTELMTNARRAGTARDEAWQVRKDGSTFRSDATVTALVDDSTQHLLGYACIVRDITVRLRAEEQQESLVHELTERAGAEAATRAARTVNRAARAEATLVANRASVLAEVSHVLVENFMNHRPVLGQVAQIVAQAAEAACVIQFIAQEGDAVGLVAQAFHHPDELVHAELAHSLRFSPTPTESPWDKLGQAFLDQRPLTDTLSVPMLARTAVIGVLSLGRFACSADTQFTDGDRAFAVDVAARVALAVENARLYENAQTAIELRDKFLDIAAHELKTPLTSIQGYSQLLASQIRDYTEQDAAPIRRSASMIADRTKHLARLVEQILDVSRLVSSRMVLNRENIDLIGLISNLVVGFKNRDEPHEFRLHFEHTSLQAPVDPLRFAQVLNNLIENAVRYSPGGGPIDVTASVENDDYVVVSVRDRGLGIPLDLREYVFDRFFQAHSVDYRSGMGLGLHISQEIAMLHGGNITAT